ncbi:nucleotide exchange factor GrpE [Hyphomicrobium sp.]|uniref:nucleotide exchange factor GrpE n=1 Tax=Hyphomicrobium sp. TaxID=82 RepID=UPI002FE376E7
MADETTNPDAPGPEASGGPEAAPDPAEAALRLSAEVDTLQGQIADLTDRLLRSHAEMDNLRKRAEREREETAKYAISKFARDVVAVADNFERALQAVPADAVAEDGALRSLVDGITMTEREFLNVLERNGVKRLNPKGEVFNPHQHQAMMEMQNTEVPAGTILEVFQCGYLIEDRVLRPAMVVVAKGGPKPGREAPAEAQDGAGGETSRDPEAGNDNAG